MAGVTPHCTTITIVCSQKRKHPFTSLGTVEISDDGELQTPPNLDSGLGKHADRRKHECVWLEDYFPKERVSLRVGTLDFPVPFPVGPRELRLRMSCSRCPCDVPLRYETAVTYLSKMRDAGVFELDISALP